MKHMNIRTPTGAIVLALTLVISFQSAQADDQSGSYQMSVVLDRAHGDIVSSGNFEKAILRISSRHSRFPYATATNLCVAHTMVGQFKHAEHYCDEALVEAEKAAARGMRKGRDYTAEWALAYSNRGVLRARMGDTSGAGEDFRMAIELKADTDVPMNNLARLNPEPIESFVAK
jgi:Tfp pilus assembly protein PilF